MSDLGARQRRSGAGCSTLRCRCGGRSARTTSMAASTKQSSLTAGRSVRPHRARTIARQAFPIVKPAVSAGTAPGARRRSTRSISSASISSPRTRRRVRRRYRWQVSDPSFDLTIRLSRCSPIASGQRISGEEAAGAVAPRRCEPCSNETYAHPLGGFLEDRTGALPQRSNPHMHCSRRRSHGSRSTGRWRPGAG